VKSSEISSVISSTIASSIQSSRQSSIIIIVYASSSQESNTDDDDGGVSLELTFCGDDILQKGEQCERTVDTCIKGFGCSVTSCTCVPEKTNIVFRKTETEILAEIITVARETFVAAASVCGNGVLETPEECDDRNRRDSDGCSSTCLLEIGICGDGVVQSLLGEQCEQSIHDSSLEYECDNCRFISLYCGNNVLDSGEECDDGEQNSTSPDALCRSDCSLSRCGDAVVDSVETCDDGNRISGDGCDRFCREEESEVVTPPPSTVDFPSVPDTNVLGEVQQQYQQQQYPNQYQFPQYSNYQQMPYQMPLAQLQPLIQSRGPVGDTGPAAVAVVVSGMAAGMGWIRRRKRR
jgi:cysteine-rich repeat protein